MLCNVLINIALHISGQNIQKMPGVSLKPNNHQISIRTAAISESALPKHAMRSTVKTALKSKGHSSRVLAEQLQPAKTWLSSLLQ